MFQIIKHAPYLSFFKTCLSCILFSIYHSSQYPEPKPINLKQQDLSVQHLNQKFKKYTKPLKTGNKCGFIVRLVEPGTNPVHDVQISTFYQRDKPGLEEMYTIEIRRAPIPKLETKPWKVRSLFCCASYFPYFTK